MCVCVCGLCMCVYFIVLLQNSLSKMTKCLLHFVFLQQQQQQRCWWTVQWTLKMVLKMHFTYVCKCSLKKEMNDFFFGWVRFDFMNWKYSHRSSVCMWAFIQNDISEWMYRCTLGTSACCVKCVQNEMGNESLCAAFMFIASNLN